MLDQNAFLQSCSDGALGKTKILRQAGQRTLFLPPSRRGCSSVVEHLLAKEDVASSSLVTRSFSFDAGVGGGYFFESKPTSAASHYKRINMKTLPLCICSVVLAVTAMAQPAPPPPPPPSPAASASMTASASPAQDLADRIHQPIEKQLNGQHGIVIDGDCGAG